MGAILAFFYGIVPNAGFAIIMLTVVVRLILFPLTAKQAKSMIAMQRAQPEIKKLQAKYKNDKQKLNEELMKFYKENKINPLGGCLPLLVQMPVFIALYQTLNEIQHFIPQSSSMYADICTPRARNPCKVVSLDFFGMNLTAVRELGAEGLRQRAPLLHPRRPRRRSPRSSSSARRCANQTQVNPQMQIIGKVMPVIFGFISHQHPRRCGPLLPHQQPVADRPAGGRVPHDRDGRRPTQGQGWQVAAARARTRGRDKGGGAPAIEAKSSETPWRPVG